MNDETGTKVDWGSGVTQMFQAGFYIYAAKFKITYHFTKDFVTD